MPSSQERMLLQELLRDECVREEIAHQPSHGTAEARSPRQVNSGFESEQQADERVKAGVRSPCNGTCVLSPHDGLCLGCLRTKSEITGWTVAGDDERARIVERCGERQRLWQDDQTTGNSSDAGSSNEVSGGEGR